MRTCKRTMASQNGKINTLRSSAGRKGSSFFGSFIQPKLAVNQPNDVYELEADAMADHIMRMPVNGQPFFSPLPNSDPTLRRSCAKCEEEKDNNIHRKENSSRPAAPDSDVSS